MRSPISIVDVDRLDTWSRYRAGLCETCAQDQTRGTTAWAPALPSPASLRRTAASPDGRSCSAESLPLIEPPIQSAGAASFQTIAVSGQDDIVAEAAGDTITVVAGSNVSVTTNAANKTLTIAANAASGASVNLWQLLL